MAKKIESESMTGAHKAAAFLLMMGEEYTTEVFKNMNEVEITRIATAMTQLDKVPPEMLTTVTKEFVDNYEKEDQAVLGGGEFIRNVIGRTLTHEKAASVFKEIELSEREKPFTWSWNVNSELLAVYLRGEHPQTIAMILAHLPPSIASDVLSMMPDEKKGDIAMRVAQLGQVPEEIVMAVDEALRREMSALGGSGSGQTGGINVLVDIINGVDKNTEDIIMETIEEKHTEMAADIRQMMFVFEDLSTVDDRGMREILKKVESSQLTLALKTASEEMKQKILSNLSARAAEMLMEDLEVMGPVKLSEVEEAQQSIVAAAKELEEEGTITLGGKGKEDVLV